MATVLIVDDVAIMRRSIRSLLTGAGHEVVAEAEDGLEGFQLYQKHKPDLVTMDISMPRMNGIKATEVIVKKFPDANVIVISSQGEKENVIEAIKHGAKGYILKPIDSKNLMEVLEKLNL